MYILCILRNKHTGFYMWHKENEHHTAFKHCHFNKIVDTNQNHRIKRLTINRERRHQLNTEQQQSSETTKVKKNIHYIVPYDSFWYCDLSFYLIVTENIQNATPAYSQ